MSYLTVNKAMEIVRALSGNDSYSEEEAFLMSEALEYMLMHDEENKSVWMFNLGALYDRLEKYGLSEKYYTLCLDNQNNTAYLGLGEMYEHMGDFRKARDCYCSAYSCGFPQGLKNLERLFRKEAEAKEGKHGINKRR